jgi:hypothetical protein
VNFNVALRNNFTRVKRSIEKKLRDNTWVIDKQIEYYEANAESCLCGEIELLSKMFRIDIPCLHIYKIKREFPELPDIKLEISKSIDRLELFFEDAAVKYREPELLAENMLRFKAVKVIRRFSHCKNESAIRADVTQINFNDEFANDMPTSYHEVIADGISKFYTGKK